MEVKALRTLLTVAGALALVAALGAGWLVLQLRQRGMSARDEPSRLEAAVARRLRTWATPAGLLDARNPVAASPEALSRARARTSRTTARRATATTAAGPSSVGASIRRPPT